MRDALPSVAGPANPEASAPLDVDNLYRTYFRALSAAVRRRFGAGPPEPEEAAQAAFAQFAGLSDPKLVQNPRGFLLRSACNFVIDYRRHAMVTARAEQEIVTLDMASPTADPGPERVILARNSLAAVSAAIDELDQRRRDVLTMRSMEGLSGAEIARRLGISPTRVVQLYAEAIKACAQALNEGESVES